MFARDDIKRAIFTAGKWALRAEIKLFYFSGSSYGSFYTALKLNYSHICSSVSSPPKGIWSNWNGCVSVQCERGKQLMLWSISVPENGCITASPLFKRQQNACVSVCLQAKGWVFKHRLMTFFEIKSISTDTVTLFLNLRLRLQVGGITGAWKRFKTEYESYTNLKIAG